MRYFKITFISLVSIFFLSIITAFIIGYIYEEDAEKYIISQLNKQLNTQVIIDTKNIDLSLLENFPSASLDFKNIIASTGKDTLFTASGISLRFNVIDLFHKNYRIKKIKVTDANLTLRIDNKGKDNYHFLKTSEDTTRSSFSFALEKFILKNVRISYVNQQAKSNASLIVKNAEFAGKFNPDKYVLECKGETFVHHIKADSSVLISQQPLDFKLDLFVDSRANYYEIKSSEVLLSDVKLNVVGNVITSDYEDVLNLSINGKDMNIKSVLTMLPEKYKKGIKDYESTGSFYFESFVKGGLSKEKSPSVSAKFGIGNADIINKKSGITLKNVNLKGRFMMENFSQLNGSLHIDDFSAKLNDGNLQGNFSMDNFVHPFIKMDAKAKLNLAQVQKFISIDTIENLSGELNLNVSFNGEIMEPSKMIADNFQRARASGEMSIRKMNMNLKNNQLKFDNLNGDFAFNNNDVIINNFRGNISKSDFELKGSFKNFMTYIFMDNAPLIVEATLKSKNINLDELMSYQSSTSAIDSTYSFKISPQINFNIQNTIDHVTFKKFEGVNIKGNIKISNKQITTDSLILNTMDGSIICSGIIDANDNDKIFIGYEATIKRINIHKLFYQMENFGQQVMQEKNLEGILSAHINGASIWNSHLMVDLDKVYVRGDLTIYQGQLIKFEPMKSLSSFIKVSELENIRFSNLHNQIEIKNQKIFIPLMEIKSSALNLSGSGVHSFNNELDYKIKILLSDLIAKKARKEKKENGEFGVIEDDGLGKTSLFLSMTGTLDNPIIKYDRKSAVAKVKQDFKVEKQNLKKILKEEFSWIKKDSATTNKKQEAKRQNEKFIIKWDENEKDKNKEVKEEDF